jgi:hypothetical protein
MGVDQSALLSMLTGAPAPVPAVVPAATTATPAPVPSTIAPAAAAATPAGGTDPQALLRNLAAAFQAQAQAPSDVDLQAVLDPAKIGQFLHDPTVLEQLLPHLPEGSHTGVMVMNARFFVSLSLSLQFSVFSSSFSPHMSSF